VLGNRLRGLTLAQSRALLDLFTKSAADYLDGWFESEPVKALFGFDAVVGNYASPFTPGTAYVLLHHVFGEVNGKKAVWGHAIGGMGAITQAMAKAARAHGVEIVTDAPVREVTIEGSRAVGVVLESGEEIRAEAVAANLNPKLLYTRMVAPDALPADFLARMQRWKCGSGTFRMNVALSRLPSFFPRCPARIKATHHTAGHHLRPEPRPTWTAPYQDARERGWSREPIVELVIPSTLDDSLAPKGAHVASLFCQHVAPELPDGPLLGRSPRGGGRPDDRHGRALRARVRDSVHRAPGAHAARPRAGLRTHGRRHLHGALSLDQLFSARPDARPRRLSGPVPGLYHCGAGAHPGGGVTGAPGHNAAAAIRADLLRATGWRTRLSQLVSGATSASTAAGSRS
jgi:phytoene dehydrogenase-like protein